MFDRVAYKFCVICHLHKHIKLELAFQYLLLVLYNVQAKLKRSFGSLAGLSTLM